MTVVANDVLDRRQEVSILVIDDHPLIRAGMGHLLGRLADDVSLTEAGDVSKGVSILAEPREFDLVLVDLMMPGMNGFDGLARFDGWRAMQPSWSFP